VRTLPGGVVGWLLAWGLTQPARTPQPADLTELWLPSLSSRTLHLVDTSRSDPPEHYLSACRNGLNHIELLPKAPLSPGDRYEPHYDASADGLEYLWQVVAAVLYNWQQFQLSDDSVTHADAILVIEEGLDRIRLVHNGTLFTEQLHDLGTRFSRFPTEAGELLPWLVLAAANGISGLCRRCTGA